MTELEQKLGYEFRDPALLRTALTHSSWTNEHHEPHNERLEFLGDAVLQLVVSAMVYERVAGAEGQLTAVRQALVQGVSLTGVAARLDLGPHLRLGRSARNDGVDTNAESLEDAVEAVIAAVYLDGGIDAATRVVGQLLGDQVDELVLRAAVAPVSYDNAKSRLNELSSSRWKQPPTYVLIEKRGSDNAPVFKWEVMLPDGRRFQGEGRNAKSAQQAAAASALADLG